uniref:Chitin-binding type-2 domain-containing protein n=1 Tax=Aceria tosichella TaxID=561515 RepID=A0A6G1S8C7_9ACAR
MLSTTTTSNTMRTDQREERCPSVELSESIAPAIGRCSHPYQMDNEHDEEKHDHLQAQSARRKPLSRRRRQPRHRNHHHHLVVPQASFGRIERMDNGAARQRLSRISAGAIWWLLCCWLMVGIIKASASMNLPDGIENILGFVPQSTFKCEREGYFGDIDNDCRLFHLCQRQVGQGGKVEWRHWTYACGNQTMFNQLTLTCAFVDEAIPCKHASKFQYLNEVIHKPAEAFLTDADVTSGFSYYSNRIMSDGARQRAFEDSQLLAQIGGPTVQAQQALTQSQTGSGNSFLKPLPASSNNHHSNQQDQLNALTFNSLADEQLNQALQWSAANFAATSHQQNQAEQSNNIRKPLGQEQFGPAQVSAPTTNTRTGQDQVDLIENHSFQFQHQPEARHLNQFGAGQLHQTTFTNQRTQQSESGAIAPASSNERQTFSAPSTGASLTSETHNGNNNNFHQPAQNTQFEYSIRTDHQENAPSEPANVIFRQQPQQRVGEFNPRQLGSIVSGSNSSPSTTATLSAMTTTTTTATTTTQRQQFQTSPASTTPTPELVPKFTSSQRLTTSQVTTLVAPTTSTTTTSSTTVQPQQNITVSNTTGAPSEAQLQNRSRFGSNNSTTNQQTIAPRRASGVSTLTSSGRLQRAGFQSNRISGQQAQKRQAEPTPIVMRKSLRSGPDTTGRALPAQSPLVSSPEGGQMTSWSTGGDFWRRSFDSQLMAPKFESLLLRRRV